MDGLNSSLSTRGMPDRIPQEKMAKGPGGFEDVLKGQQKTNQPTPKETPPSRATESKKEAPEVKEQTNERVEKPKTKKGRSDKEDAMLEFMDSMQNEFGIPPARIVEAMAKLPKDELLQSPEETASQVIDSLDLPPEQSEQAYSKYIGLLGLLAQAPQQQVQTPIQSAVQAANATANSISRERRALLNDSLDRMSQKFFVKDAIVPAKSMTTDELVDRLSFEKGTDLLSKESLQQDAASIPIAESLQAKSDSMNAKLESLPLTPLKSDSTNAKSSLLNTKPEFFPNPILNATTDLSVSAKQLQSAKLGEQSQALPESTQGLMAKLATLGVSAGALNKALEKVPMSPSAGQAKELGSAPSFDLNGLNLSDSAMKAISSGAHRDGFGSGDSSDSESDLGTSQSDLTTQGLGAESLKKGERPQSFKEALAVAAPSPAHKGETNPNVEKLMSQVNMIVRKGGGEATVRMSPEGMGEIQLKIIVKDGKVNVEMAADTKEAKKLLEGSIADLKLGLGQHKLSVESIKVDVGNQTSTDQQNHQQKNPDLSQDQGRNQARQFMQQFRDDNIGRRDPFFETPGAKAYGRTNQGPQPLQPAEEVQSRVARGTGGKMNLVA